jgi:hypothetical protein
MSSATEVLGVRSTVADQLQAGEVCKSCNGGWMNALDKSVEEVLMRLATTSIADGPQDVTPQQLRQLARWVLKTAVAFALTFHVDRRHIRTDLARHIRRHGWLPSGFAAFVCRSVVPSKGVAISQTDAWPIKSAAVVLSVPQTRRLKFAARYDNLVIGCVMFQSKHRPIFHGVGGFHFPIATVGADFLLADPAEIHFDELSFTDAIHDTVLNRALISIDVSLNERS